jgi:hypothetical protein
VRSTRSRLVIRAIAIPPPYNSYGAPGGPPSLQHVAHSRRLDGDLGILVLGGVMFDAPESGVAPVTRHRHALLLRVCYGMVVSLTGLARVALTIGDLTEARDYLLRALKMQPHSCPIQHPIDAGAVMAELRQAEGQWEAAAELCAALSNWPATPKYAPTIVRHLRKDLEERLRGLEAHLPAEVFTAATARGRSREIGDVVAELVGEKTTNG